MRFVYAHKCITAQTSNQNFPLKLCNLTSKQNVPPNTAKKPPNTQILQKKVFSDWSLHTRLSQQSSPCLQTALLYFKSFHLASLLAWTPTNNANVWRGDAVMSWSHRIKGRATDKAFQEQCSLWERGASAGFFLTFETFYQNTQKERKTTKKQNESPLNSATITIDWSHWTIKVFSRKNSEFTG